MIGSIVEHPLGDLLNIVPNNLIDRFLRVFATLTRVHRRFIFAERGTHVRQSQH